MLVSRLSLSRTSSSEVHPLILGNDARRLLASISLRRWRSLPSSGGRPSSWLSVRMSHPSEGASASPEISLRWQDLNESMNRLGRRPSTVGTVVNLFPRKNSVRRFTSLLNSSGTSSNSLLARFSFVRWVRVNNSGGSVRSPRPPRSSSVMLLYFPAAISSRKVASAAIFVSL